MRKVEETGETKITLKEFLQGQTFARYEEHGSDVSLGLVSQKAGR